MNKRQKLKKKKKEYITFAYKIDIASEMKEDSIAHKIKSFFDSSTLNSRLLFKYDNENKKLLVSKKTLIYILSLVNTTEILNDYDMEIVDKINIYESESEK